MRQLPEGRPVYAKKSALGWCANLTGRKTWSVRIQTITRLLSPGSPGAPYPPAFPAPAPKLGNAGG